MVHAKSTRSPLLHPLLGGGGLSSRGAGGGRVCLCQLPLAFPKFNHQRLPLQNVPIHQQHRILGRLSICKKRAKWAEMTQQVLTHTRCSHVIVCTVIQRSSGVLQLDKYSSRTHPCCFDESSPSPEQRLCHDRKGSKVSSCSMERGLCASRGPGGKMWHLQESGKNREAGGSNSPGKVIKA